MSDLRDDEVVELDELDAAGGDADGEQRDVQRESSSGLNQRIEGSKLRSAIRPRPSKPNFKQVVAGQPLMRKYERSSVELAVGKSLFIQLRYCHSIV